MWLADSVFSFSHGGYWESNIEVDVIGSRGTSVG